MDTKIKEGNEKLNVSIRKELKELLKSKAKNKRDLGRLIEEAIIKTYGEPATYNQLKDMFLTA